MKKTQIFEQKCLRKVWRHGARTAMLFEGEFLAGDTPMARHTYELAQALCAQVEAVYLPAAAVELERLVGGGRGYDFIPHRLRFCARAHPLHAKIRLELSLCHAVGKDVRLLQSAQSLWSADGAYRLR